MDYLKVVILAVVEGLTEFLPISSTGHLILVEDLIGLPGSRAFVDAFLIVIQLPAILAVVVYFWARLWPFEGATIQPDKFRLWTKIVVAFLPAAVIGVLVADFIEARLFNSVTVAIALAVGGVLLILLERRQQAPRVVHVDQISYAAAIGVGLFQCVAMIPGTSRSAATIIGAMLLGTNRAVAAEFSFFLAVPTLAGAAVYKIAKHGLAFGAAEWGMVAIGSVISFLVAYASVAFLMRYIQHHIFTAFGVYRIVLGVLVLTLMLLT